MMNQRFKVALLSLVSGFVCLMLGVVLGVIIEKSAAKKRERPEVWRRSALKQLERLKPDERQRAVFTREVDQTVAELSQIKDRTEDDVWRIIQRADEAISHELTPEQKQKWATLRPRRQQHAAKNQPDNTTPVPAPEAAQVGP